MNYRVVLVVMAILLFAGGFGTLNYLSDPELNIEQAYDAGTITIIQKTSAGSVPHEVTVINKGEQAIKVEKGYTLTSNTSEDLVIAREEIISPQNNGTVLAYCLEPEINAQEETELAVSTKAPQLIMDLVTNSNPQNPAEAFKTQLKIWILVSDGEVDIYEGEVLSLSRKQGISSFELQNNISTSKIEVMTQFNLTETDITNISTNVNLMNPPKSWWDQITGTISEFIGI